MTEIFKNLQNIKEGGTYLGEIMKLKTRRLVKNPNDGSGRPAYYYDRYLTLDSSQVAVIISDMWDIHWCRQKTGNSATERVEELAVPINALLVKLRKEFKDICIIHCPSTVRERAYGPNSNRNDITEGERLAYRNMQPYLDQPKEAKFPYKDSVLEPSIRKKLDPKGVECDCSPYPDKKCTAVYQYDRDSKRIWTRQHKSIVIEGSDYIASIDEDGWNDSVISFMQNRSNPIKYALMVGVHTNFCILTRSFGMKNLLKAGITPILLRDLTDGMIPREQPPFKDHFSGLEDVFDFIESYGTTDGSIHCYTALSSDILKKDGSRLLDGEEFRFKYDYRLCRDSKMVQKHFDRIRGFSTDGRKDYQIYQYALPSSIVFQISFGRVNYLDFEYDYVRKTENDCRCRRHELEFGEYITEVGVLLGDSKQYGGYFIDKLYFLTNIREYVVGFIDDKDEYDIKNWFRYVITAREGYAITFLQSQDRQISGEKKALNYIQFYSQQLQQFQVKTRNEEKITTVLEYLNHDGDLCSLIFMNGQYLCLTGTKYSGHVDKVDSIDYLMPKDGEKEKKSAKIVGLGFEIAEEESNPVNEITCIDPNGEIQTSTRYFEEEKKEN